MANDRRNTIRKATTAGLMFGLMIGLTLWFMLGLAFGLAFGLAVGLAFGLAFGSMSSAWIHWLILIRIWLPLSGRLPWPINTFLKDAHHRGVLRQAGAVYQFRHARLQHHLTAQPPTVTGSS